MLGLKFIHVSKGVLREYTLHAFHFMLSLSVDIQRYGQYYSSAR